MTKYHFYIVAGQQVDSTAKFFRVGIGTTKQADRDFLFLLKYAADNGHYFSVWSREVDDFIHRLADSLNLDCLPIQAVNARELVRSFRERTSLPFSQDALKNTNAMRYAFNVDYRISSNLNRREASVAKR